MKYYQQPVSVWDKMQSDIWFKFSVMEGESWAIDRIFRRNRNVKYTQSRKVWIEG